MQTRNTFSLSLARRWAAATLLAGMAAGAVAQPVLGHGPSAPAALDAATMPHLQRLNIGQIYDVVSQAGYTHVKEIEWSDGRYEVDARSAQGVHVEIDVDGRSGKILRVRNED